MQTEKLIYVDRKGSDCLKWDGMQSSFGESELLPLWVADMDFMCPASVRQALEKWAAHGVFGYYQRAESYLESFLRWEEERHGYTIQPEWVRFSPGIVSAIYWLVQLLTQPGEPVTVLTPVYYPFLNAVKDNGRKLAPCSLACHEGNYTIDFGRLDRHFQETDSKLLIFSSPHNPVGRVWRRAELEELVQVCQRHGVIILSDEIHQDLVLSDHPHIPTGTVISEGVITLCSASKSFNIAGLKNSFLVIPDPAIRRRFDRYVKGIHIMDGNQAGYVAAEAAFTGGVPWLNSLLQQLRENDQLVRARLQAALPKVVIPPLEGTYLQWVDLRAYVAPENVQALVQRACGLAVDYGEWFGGDEWKGIIRLNLATSPENISLAVDRLAAALTE